jgi:polynucleotide 5'-hydroxyl-kinase GRC3/NOL9
MTAPDDALVYVEWEPTLNEIATADPQRPLRVMLLGGTDVGKTTFTRLLVNRLTGAGRRVGIVDADLGQSEIGPPTCIGMAFADAPVPALSSLTPHTLAFVGSTSPPGHLLEHAAGVCRLADLVRPHPLVVDTSGFLHGAVARRLNQAEFDLLQPTHLVALQRDGELEATLAPMRRRESCALHMPAIPAVIGKKPSSFRAQRRTMRFAAYFDTATLYTYTFDQVALVGTWLNSGTPLAPHLLKFLNQSLGEEVRVYHAEMFGRHLGLMVSRPAAPDSPGIGIAQQQLRAQTVSITVAPRLKHLLLGLEGGNGKLLGLGLLEAIDFRRRTLGVLTPVRAPGAAQVIRLGGLRVAPNGSEIGTLHPNEL